MINRKYVFLVLLIVFAVSIGGGIAVGAIVRNLMTADGENWIIDAEIGSEEVPDGFNNESGEVVSADMLAEMEMIPDLPEFQEDVNPTVLPASSALGNCTMQYGQLMLINPVFTVSTDYIATRKNELIDLTATYGISELHSYNGRPLLDAEAGEHLNEMLTAYSVENPGHTISTVSCFRSVGTACGRLCYATGTSDHHTGYTCDLIDASYGGELDTDDYGVHLDWQWLHANSYKYGFIDRFIYDFAGGPMSEPVNITEEGSTGLYETWHYRYVGLKAAAEIAEGNYNQGNYDSLEHYLKATGRVTSLVAGRCD